MTKEEFLEELAAALNEEPEGVSPGTEMASLDGWDSTGLLGVIALLDGELGVQVDVTRLRDCKTVQDLIDLTGETLE